MNPLKVNVSGFGLTQFCKTGLVLQDCINEDDILEKSMSGNGNTCTNALSICCILLVTLLNN